MTTEQETVRRIGRYEVIRKIATGGMAELFLARFVGPGGFEKRCALKRILPQFAADQTFQRMFLNEARVTAMFDHPNLVQIFELGQDQRGQFFIAMELVNGLNLRQLLHLCHESGVTIPPELAAYMMTQALDGLAYAHSFRDPDGRPLNLVHRDISPQNILVSYEGAVKLVDFGIVKGSSISGETQAGMLKGKVAYMSPEQASGETIDARSDLFSLGVCFYELIALERPFTGANEIMTLKAILEDPPRHLTDYSPDCSERIERAIYTALEKSPEHRFPGAHDFQLELQDILRACPAPIGRHVVAEFLRSLTEGSTVSFDASRLRIPRRVHSVGFGHHVSAQDDGTWEESNPRDALNGVTLPTPGAPMEPTPTPPGVRDSHPPPSLVASSSQSFSGERSMDMSAELDAAGVGRRPTSWVLAVFGASALAGAALVWTATRHDIVLVEPAPIALVQAATPVAAPDPGSAILAAPPPVEATGPANPPVAEPPPTPPEVEAAPPPPPKPPKSRARRASSASRARAPRVAEPAPRAAPSGSLSLVTTPAGLTVRRGEESLGRTPLEVKLPVGTHTLHLVSSPLGIAQTVRVVIEENGRTKEKLEFGRATLKVVSRPWAEVYVNGVHKGKTPLQIPVYAGRHEVRLVSPEAGERIQKVAVAEGATELVLVKF